VRFALGDGSGGKRRAAAEAAPSPAMTRQASAESPGGGEEAFLDVYENALTHERRHGHPGPPLMLPTVRGMQRRAARNLKPSSTDGCVQFVDAEGEPFFYDFKARKRTSAFPQLEKGDVPPCVLPTRKLEPSAQHLANMGEAMIPPTLDYDAAVEEARRMLYEPRKQARAAQLAHEPCPLDEILMNAQYLGLSPVEHVDCMFLVDAMLSPELPCGWLRCASPGMSEGDEYYWSALLGWAQWEHPQVSLLTGVVSDLKKRFKKRGDLRQREQQAREAALQAEQNAKLRPGEFWHKETRSATLNHQVHH